MDQEKIGKFIQNTRKAKNLTQEELAQKLGVTNKSVSRWENGKCMPDLSLIKDICKELDISINDFLSGEHVDKKDYEKKLEENIIEVTNYNNKNKRKNFSIFLIVLILLSPLIYLLINTIDGSGFNYINIDEYFVSKKINNYIKEQDIEKILEQFDWSYMYEEYKEFNCKIIDEENKKIIYDYTGLDTYEDYKRNITTELKETISKIKINKLENIEGYGNIFYKDTQEVYVQYGINPKDVIFYTFKNNRIEIGFYYQTSENNVIYENDYMPNIYLKR